jgi:hypothetical protein
MARLNLRREPETPMGEFNPKRENSGNERNQSAQVAGSRAEARFDLGEVWGAGEFHPKREDTVSARPGSTWRKSGTQAGFQSKREKGHCKLFFFFFFFHLPFFCCWTTCTIFRYTKKRFRYQNPFFVFKL